MDLDPTFFVQAFLVLTSLALLGPILFNPMLELIELREKSIAGAKIESVRLLEQTQEKERALEAQLEDARRGALAERQKLINDARRAALSIFSPRLCSSSIGVVRISS
mgnify:CR=1 FL=1